MKASKISDAQKAFILTQGADGVPVANICRKARISPATDFNWKKKYEGMQPPEMRRLNQLDASNNLVFSWLTVRVRRPDVSASMEGRRFSFEGRLAW